MGGGGACLSNGNIGNRGFGIVSEKFRTCRREFVECDDAVFDRSNQQAQLDNVRKLRLGLPNVLNKVSLTFFVLSVSVALQAPPAVKMQQQENQQLEL